MDIFRELKEILKLECLVLEWVDVNSFISRVFEMLDDKIPISVGYTRWPM